ncbi:hypothetical protein GCM10023196_050850 [Actinoallomurus vinaceus]|uniref:Alpha-1,2-mannosidase n=1 Tax=Actinoallomurus vinaceus TaxID=1080074 RepID=A0ABP8UEV3_9ACTN
MVVIAAAGTLAAGGGATAGARALAVSPPGGSAGDALVSDPASLVDPLIGTGSGGATVGQVDTYPGATAPFGMVSFSPDTPSRPDGGGYNYDDSAITGFSLTHMSGPGCGAFGDFPILPTVGALDDDPANTTAAFQHGDEHAAPGSYSVGLNPGKPTAVRADLAATARTGIGRFTYPGTTAANLLFKMGAAQSGNQSASVQVVGDDEVTGTETAGQFCGSPGTYPVHFVAKFSRPFSSYGTWHTAPTGPNVFTQQAGDLPWSYHEVASGGTAASITPAKTPDGSSAVAWKQSNALANTWIETTPPALPQGDTYQATVTLQGSGNVYLNFYNGRQDVGGKAVKLTSTPVTLTVDAPIPTGSIGRPQFQVRTAGDGPVDLLASAVSIRQETVVKTPGSTKMSTHGTGAPRVPAGPDGRPAGEIVHRLLTSVYADTPGGEPGNDDLGSMSSWYVWSSLGMYPATPGTPVLALGAPIFSRAEFDLPGGHHLKLTAPGASTTAYVHGVSVNGKPWAPAWLSASLLTGADAPSSRPATTELAFTLTPTADTSWAATASDAPPSYPAGPLKFPPGRKPVILTPTGPNLLGSAPTGELSWHGPVQNGVGSVPGTVDSATSPEGKSAVHWTETNAAPNTWIWVDPESGLPAGQSYQASITLEGTGTVYLDFWNGQQDLTSQTVQLTGTPQTLTIQGAVPSAADTHVQIRTADTGPVNLYASDVSLRLLTPQQS